MKPFVFKVVLDSLMLPLEVEGMYHPEAIPPFDQRGFPRGSFEHERVDIWEVKLNNIAVQLTEDQKQRLTYHVMAKIHRMQQEELYHV